MLKHATITSKMDHSSLFMTFDWTGFQLCFPMRKRGGKRKRENRLKKVNRKKSLRTKQITSKVVKYISGANTYCNTNTY
jgi:hypothetical protein